MLGLRKLDWLLILFSLAGIILSLIFFYQPSQQKHLVIWADGERTVRSLHDSTFEVKSKSGSVTVKVSDGKVRLVESTCHDRWCIRMGPISRPGESMVCLPSKILVTIEARSPDDKDPDIPDMITR